MPNPLREWRERHGLTQTAVSAGTGIAQALLSKYEQTDGEPNRNGEPRRAVRPNRRNAVRIEAFTSNLDPEDIVRVEDWDATGDAEPEAEPGDSTEAA